MQYFCCDDRRRNEVAGHGDLNGIEFLEVLDTPDQPPDDRQRTLFVHFIHDPSPLGITRENVVITGGERIRDIRVKAAVAQVDSRSGSADPVLVVEVDTPGDFSTYTLRLVPTSASPLPGLDPVLRAVDFSFKVNCETKFDPLHPRTCPPEHHREPAIDYVARDYPSFRRMVLDRLSVLVPDWKERSPADLGTALCELTAYLGDQLSYRQDAVAAEAYLGTCRLRTSARRHARLVDYLMHDGCNARTWIHLILADETPSFTLSGATFTTAVPGLPPRIVPGSRDAARALDSGAIAYRLLEPAVLSPLHNRISFYTWGSRECCLPRGATKATLRGRFPDLRPGMVLIFAEVRSPRTGDPDDAVLTHRHAVRLVGVREQEDPVGGRFELPPTSDPVPVTEITWAAEDALPFPLCISAETADAFGAAYVDEVSVALGNIVLADHGADVDEHLGVVPEDWLEQVRADVPDKDEAGDRCRPDRLVLAPARFRPRLRRGPLTQEVPFDPTAPPDSAARSMRVEARDAVPAITLDDGSSDPWNARLDLLSSRATDKHFVVEVEADGRARVRFGDGRHGARPRAETAIQARYRVGNGPGGNVGADTLVHVITGESTIERATNPLPAAGGVGMETIEEVLQRAPFAFRPQTKPGHPNLPDGKTLGRAVTPADYAAVAEMHPEVQRAAASFRWTGSWRTVSITVDRLGGLPIDEGFERRLREHLEAYRLAGHDLEVEAPRPVSLEVAMRVVVKPGFHITPVRRALLEEFSNRILPDGRRGVFHPDNLTFGQTIYLSPLYAAAQRVDGVESVDITTFQRRDRPGISARDEGRLRLGRQEIARLDNDPNFPERGTLTLTLEGRP